MEPDAVEIRALGCLLEKQRTTPDAYPLSLNGLRLACNQATNRDPVVAYEEGEIREAMQRLGRRGWARLASGHTTRAIKYRHLLDEALGLGPDELALLCVLMLRGPQTPGELKQRSDRLHPAGDLTAVQATLERLAARELATSLGRRPGQKEERWAQRLGGDEEPDISPTPGAAPTGTTPPASPSSAASPQRDRLAELEAEVASLRADLDALRRELGV
jgi:uncharacterized protein YceH (UPF0502 family)